MGTRALANSDYGAVNDRRKLDVIGSWAGPASDDDLDWFIGNPGRRYRLRTAFPGEPSSQIIVRWISHSISPDVESLIRGELAAQGAVDTDKTKVVHIAADFDAFPDDEDDLLKTLFSTLAWRGNGPITAGDVAVLAKHGHASLDFTLKTGREPFENEFEFLEFKQKPKPKFQISKKTGKPIANLSNIKIALQRLGVTLQHDTFQDRSTITGLEGFELLDDRVADRLWLTIQEKFEFLPPKDYFWTVIADEARRNSFHPVRDYLDAQFWDEVKRIDRWLVDYAGAEDTPYVRAVGALMLIAAVRRIRKPGCKFDEMPVFISEQGLNKSTALATLTGNPEWFSDNLPLSADAKTMIEHLKGRWIVEAAELNGMRRGDVQHLKSFLSRTIDRARMSYDRSISELLRQCIIVGTTNDEAFLRDQTGNRRYWPVAVGAFKLDKLKADRDQLWAEAAAREAQGDSIRLAQDLWPDAAKEQAKRTIHDPWIEEINTVLGDAKGKLLANEMWRVVRVAVEHRTQGHNERLGAAMNACGWQREKVRFKTIGVKWAYVRGPKPYPELKLDDAAEGVEKA